MTTARDLRRCALQALYQFDAGNDETPEIVRESLAGSAGGARTHDEGFRLARAAWEQRARWAMSWVVVPATPRFAMRSMAAASIRALAPRSTVDVIIKPSSV